MTLEELKALLDAAIEASKAAPDDEALKTKVTEAQAAYDTKLAEEEADPETDPEVDEDKIDEKTKAYLAKLRKENANHRTKNKDLASKLKVTEEQRKAILKAVGIEDESEKPEEKVKALTAGNQNLAFENAVLKTAVQHGIPADGLEFFEFLVSKATSELEEGEELPEDKLAEIVAKAKKQSKGSANSSVNGGDGKGGNAPPPGGKPGEVTLAKFVKMSITEKSKLYETNQGLYTSLLADAKAKKMLV